MFAAAYPELRDVAAIVDTSARRARVAVAPLCELRAPGYCKVIFRTALPAC